MSFPALDATARRRRARWDGGEVAVKGRLKSGVEHSSLDARRSSTIRGLPFHRRAHASGTGAGGGRARGPSRPRGRARAARSATRARLWRPTSAGVVFGEAGIGKTTVLEALVGRIAADADLLIASGACLKHYGATETYFPVSRRSGDCCASPALSASSPCLSARPDLAGTAAVAGTPA